MKDKKILIDQSPEASKFQLVLAAAKRSKQINYMAKERGLPPNQVASIKTKYIKPPTIALMEIMEGRVVNFSKNGEDSTNTNNSINIEESS
jgi:DNA-directed RNA polymerase omega subunit